MLTNTPVLVNTTRFFQSQYAQNFEFGLSAQLTYLSTRSNVNSGSYSLNPSTSGDLDLVLTQSLLQGFGRAVNGRNIRVQKNNVKVSALQFKQQLIATVSAALNLYWDLVSFDADVRARQREVGTAQQLLDDNKKLVQFGTAAPIEITRAESQLYASQQDLVTSQTNLLQQETILKNYLSRNGVADAGLTNLHIVPLDKFVIPEKDEAHPLEDLIHQALAARPEMEQARLNLESNQMNLVGIKNSLKPTLNAFAELTNNGLSGDLTAFGMLQGYNGTLVGGYGNLLSQIFRRDYPNYSAGIIAQHTVAQSRRPGGLYHQPSGTASKRAEPAQEHQPDPGGCAERAGGPRTGARALRSRGEIPGTPGADPGRRSEKVRAGRYRGLPGGAGPARSGHRP